MKWCNLMNMWCSDMDEEDFANACCDGKCRSCEECEEVSDERQIFIPSKADGY